MIGYIGLHNFISEYKLEVGFTNWLFTLFLKKKTKNNIMQSLQTETEITMSIVLSTHYINEALQVLQIMEL